MNRLMYALAFILSIGSLNAAVIKGKTAFNEQYSLGIKYIDKENGEISIRIPIKKDGSFESEVSLDEDCIAEWYFYKTDGGRQLPYGGYIKIKKDETIEFDYMFKRGSQQKPLNIELKYNKLSKVNRVLFDYYKYNYVGKFNRDNANIKSEKELTKKLRDKDIKKLIHILFAKDEMLGSRSQLTDEDRKTLLDIFDGDFIKTITAEPLWYRLTNAFYPEATSCYSINLLEEVLHRVNQDFKSHYAKMKICNRIQNSFNYKYRLSGSFDKELEKFKKAAKAINDPIIEKKLIKFFEQKRYTALGADIPDVTFIDKNGKKVKLRDFKGKYLYIDFWFVG